MKGGLGVFASAHLRELKARRAGLDPSGSDYSPSIFDFGEVLIKLPRFFGFCFGVERAIDIAYGATKTSRSANLFVLGELIHNPNVNAELERRGLRFLPLGDLDLLLGANDGEDIKVIVPAFGIPVELEKVLLGADIDLSSHDTTCPFVRKVWKSAERLAAQGYSILIHAKAGHEETRATFSRCKDIAPTLVIGGLEDARFLVDELIPGLGNARRTTELFERRFSPELRGSFSPHRDFRRMAVINQTTMLADETAQIAELFAASRGCSVAQTGSTLCYATTRNQRATLALLDSGVDLALVVGGKNSSNTGHLAKLCGKYARTLHVEDERELEEDFRNFSCEHGPFRVAVISGASCPDVVVERVIRRILFSYGKKFDFSKLVRNF